MADFKKISDGRTALFWFEPGRIKVKPGLNGRDLTAPDNVAHIGDIAASIAANGFIQSKPLEIFSEGEDVYLADGHCRLAAINLCIARGIAVGKVPCVPETRGTNDVDRILSQDAHNSGKRLTPLELGGNIKRAMALDGTLTVADIAKRMGRSQTYVSHALDFQSAPAEVHAMVKSGEVSATFAAATIRKEGASRGVAKLKNAVETAKASGKAKATAKHAEPAGAAPVAVEALRGDKAIIATMRRALESARDVLTLLRDGDGVNDDEIAAAHILAISALKMAGV